MLAPPGSLTVVNACPGVSCANSKLKVCSSSILFVRSIDQEISSQCTRSWFLNISYKHKYHVYNVFILVLLDEILYDIFAAVLCCFLTLQFGGRTKLA